MKFTIVTGMSGAGRSSALKRLEDLGYYCVDNLPPEMVAHFAEICAHTEGIDRVAVAEDMRLGPRFGSLYDIIGDLQKRDDIDLDILFMDASDETLVRRYKEVRRKHPITGSGEILAGIKVEREQMREMKKIADHVIDTSGYSAMRLRRVIDSLYSMDNDERLLISIISFGYKRGIPLDADIVFDMRFLPNPFWDEKMRFHTGQDADVREFLMSSPIAGEFLDQLTNMVVSLVPHYLKEDKEQLVIGIGCTGGMHRSVAMAEELYRRLEDKNMRVLLEHRDLRLERNAQSQ